MKRFKVFVLAIALLGAFTLILSGCGGGGGGTTTNGGTGGGGNGNVSLKFSIPSEYSMLDMSKDGSWILCSGYDSNDSNHAKVKVAIFNGSDGSKTWEYTLPMVKVDTFEGPKLMNDVLHDAKITRDGRYAILNCMYTTKIIDNHGTIVFDGRSYTYNNTLYGFAGVNDISDDGELFIHSDPLTLFSRNGNLLWCNAGDVNGSLSNNVAISKDGSYIARDYGDVFIYNREGVLLFRVKDPDIVAEFIKFSPSGNIIFWGGLDGGRVIDLLGNTLLYIDLRNSSYPWIGDIASSYDGSKVCVGILGKVECYELKSGTANLLWNASVEGRVFSIDMSDDGSIVVVESDWGNTYLFKDGKLLFHAHNDGSAGGNIRISGDGKYFCSYGDGGKTYCYEIH